MWGAEDFGSRTISSPFPISLPHSGKITSYLSSIQKKEDIIIGGDFNARLSQPEHPKDHDVSEAVEQWGSLSNLTDHFTLARKHNRSKHTWSHNGMSSN